MNILKPINIIKTDSIILLLVLAMLWIFKELSKSDGCPGVTLKLTLVGITSSAMTYVALQLVSLAMDFSQKRRVG